MKQITSNLFQINDRNQLIDHNGQRLYLTEEERQAFMRAATAAEPFLRTFCGVLHHTGCRITEALELTLKSIDLHNETIVFRSLKKRNGKIVYRAVPVPPGFLDTLDLVHFIRPARKNWQQKQHDPLWPYSRTTAWRHVKKIMIEADIPEGPHRTSKGLRHGYGVHAISKGVSLNMLQKWLGHSMMENTAIYSNAVGEEQKKIAAQMWD